MPDSAKITVTAAARILKYQEGQDPSKGAPFEVVEKTYVLEGPQAEALLRSQDIDPEEVKRKGRLVSSN